MAIRRMISKDVVDNAPFVECSKNARYLYYELAAHADDDGLIMKTKRLMVSYECSEDDFSELANVGLIIDLGDNIYVVRDWRLHNNIPKDRYHTSNYVNKFAMICIDDESRYQLRHCDKCPIHNTCTQSVNKMDTGCIQDVSNLNTQVRLGKDSIDKDSIGKISEVQESLEKGRIVSPTSQTAVDRICDSLVFQDYCSILNIRSSQIQDEAIKVLRKTEGDFKKARQLLDEAIKAHRRV